MSTPLCSFCNERPAAISLDNWADTPAGQATPNQLLLCASCATRWQVPVTVLFDRAIAAVSVR